jgi:hypothetical protein
MQGKDGDTLQHRFIKFFPIAATTKVVKVILICRGLSTLNVQFIILQWRGFIYVKILELNVDKSASRLYVLRARGGVVPHSVLCWLFWCEHQIHIHTSLSSYLFLTSTALSFSRDCNR